MLRKISLAVSSVAAMFWVACSSSDVAGGTIDPNTLAEISSSSNGNPDVVLSSSSQMAVPSSSSQDAKAVSSSSVREDNNDPFVSSSSIGDSDPDILPASSSSYDSNDSKDIRISSSSTDGEIPHRLVTDAGIQCMANGDPSLDPAEDGVDSPLPEASRYVGTERTGFTIKWLELTAGVVAETFEVYGSGDTLYVSATFDYSNAQRHKCLSRIDFGVENDPAYTRATLLHFQDGDDSGSSGVMRIFDMDVVPVEDPE